MRISDRRKCAQCVCQGLVAYGTALGGGIVDVPTSVPLSTGSASSMGITQARMSPRATASTTSAAYVALRLAVPLGLTGRTLSTDQEHDDGIV